MAKVADGNWGLKVLSVLLAVVLWVYVSVEQNPSKEKEFKAVPVETRGVQQNLVAAGTPNTVSVRVRAGQNVAADLTSNSLEVFVDLTQSGTGQHVMKVQVKAPPGVEVLAVRPGQVSVTLEPLAERQVPIEVRYADKPKPGYRVLAANTTPDKVLLRGPESVLGRIQAAYVEVGLKDQAMNISEDLPVKLVDAAGRFIEDRLVQRSPAVAGVFVSVASDEPAKTVRIFPFLKGEPAEGYEVKSVAVEPDFTAVTGPQDELVGLSQILTQPVDISSTSRDILAEVGLNIPGLVVPEKEKVRVWVKIGLK